MECSHLRFPFSKHHVCNSFAGNYFSPLYVVLALFVFSFFVLAHSRTRRAQLVSQFEMLEIHQYFVNAKHRWLLCSDLKKSLHLTRVAKVIYEVHLLLLLFYFCRISK
jgi:hypothetical protein